MTQAGSLVKAQGSEAAISSLETESMQKNAVRHRGRECPMFTKALGRMKSYGPLSDCNAGFYSCFAFQLLSYVTQTERPINK